MTQRSNERGTLALTLRNFAKTPSLRSTPGANPTARHFTDFATARLRKCELRRQAKASQDSDPLQRTITAATTFALKSVESYQSRRGLDLDATATPSSTSWDSALLWKLDEEVTLSATKLASRPKTPTKRDVNNFLRASRRYGEGFSSILKSMDEPPSRKSEGGKSLLLCRRSEALTPKSSCVMTRDALTSKAQLVLSSLRSPTK